MYFASTVCAYRPQASLSARIKDWQQHPAIAPLKNPIVGFPVLLFLIWMKIANCHDSCCPVNNGCVLTYLCKQKEKEDDLQQDRYCCEDQPLCSVLCLFLSLECTAAQIYMPLFSFPFNNYYAFLIR